MQNSLDVPSPEISSLDQLRQIIGKPSATILKTFGKHIDSNARNHLTMTRLAAVSWLNHKGILEASILAGAEGFIEVIDAHSIRIHSPAFGDLSDNTEIGMHCMVPGYGPTLRLNGRRVANNTVEIKECFLHCPRAFMRSNIWESPPSTSPSINSPHLLKTSEAAELSATDESWIEQSPFAFLGTGNQGLELDVTPRGDPAGFIKIITKKTILIPERPGNKKANSLSNMNCSHYRQ